LSGDHGEKLMVAGEGQEGKSLLFISIDSYRIIL